MKIAVAIGTTSALVLTLLTGACSGDCLKRTEDEVKKSLSAHFAVGDSQERVELALKTLKFPDGKTDYSYDPYEKRFIVLVRDEPRCGDLQSILVYLKLDGQGRLLEIDVHRQYTSL